MLSQEQILANKEAFIGEIKSIKRKGADLEGLIKFLEGSDFFYAPASTQYNYAYEGGLCYKSLQVCNTLRTLVKNYHEARGLPFDVITEDSVRICGLFSDLGKVNYYQKGARNIKVYSEDGTKRDSLGKFDWISKEVYEVKDSKDRWIFGSLGLNAERRLSYYVALTEEESSALIHHDLSNENTQFNLYEIYGKYALVPLLHAADVTATFTLDV